MSVATDFQNLIISSLSQLDPSALPELQENVPLFWLLHARQGRLPELRYYYTRRDAIRLLMGCTRKQIDYIRRNSDSTRTSQDTERQDSTMDASSQDDSSSLSDRTSQSESDDSMTSSGSGSGGGSQVSSQHSSQSMDFRDTGFGSNYVSSRSESNTIASERGEIQTTEDTDMARRHERHGDGYRAGSSTQTTTRSAAVFTDYIPVHIDTPFGPIDFNFAPPFEVIQQTGTHGSFNSHEEQHDDMWGTLGSDRTAVITSDITILTQPKRESHTTSSLTHPRAHSSHSEFHANAVMTQSGSSASESDGSNSSSSTHSMTGSGTSSSSSNGSSHSEMAATSTRVGHSDGETHRSNQALTRTDSMTERLHQRFTHLKELWDAATQMIKWIEAQHLGTPAYVFQRIAAEYPEGVDAATANQLLVSAPYSR